MVRKNFDLAAAREASGDVPEDQTVEFTINGPDGHVYTMHKPTTAQLALFMGGVADDADPRTAAAALFEFMKNTLDTEDYRDFRRVVGDRHSSGSVEAVMEMIMELTQEFDDHPTKRPLDYLPSQGPDGSRSTGRAPGPGSTRSDYRFTDSSTSSTPGASNG